MNININGFPYEKMRSQQKQILKTIDNNWDKKYIVIEAPPGVGKSAIAMTLLSSFRKGFLITSTKQLQDQYARDFDSDYRYDLQSIKGKQNYICARNENLRCNIGECLNDKSMLNECRENGLCPYYKTKQIAQRSDIVLTSYQYFFRFADEINKPTSWKIRDIILFDEAHLLEQQIVNWASIKLIPKELSEELNLFEDLEMRQLVEIFSLPIENGYEANKKWLLSIMDCILQKRTKMMNDIKESLKIDHPENLDDDELEQLLANHGEYSKVDQLYKKLQLFFSESSKGEWLIEVIENGLSLTPLKISGIFNEYIKGWATKKIVFMSATILNMEGFCKELDIKENDVLKIKVESDFDPEKSPIIFKPICKMNYKNIDNNLPNIAKAVEEIINYHKGEKGIVHSTNYKITHYLYENVNTNRFIIKENGITNEDMIAKHETSYKDTILLSPSLTTGADLKDDLGRFSIIIKLPWCSLTDTRTQAKIKMDNDWYVTEMFKTFIQSCGRTTRSKDDWSTTYVLDSSFSYWILKYRTWFTKQFFKRIKWK